VSTKKSTILYEFGQSALAPYICSVPSMVQQV